MPLPTFLIIGAARSGTTALYYYLMQHPEVYLSPIKETNFFALDPSAGFDARKMGFDLPGDQAWIQQWVDRKHRSGQLLTDLTAYRALFDGVTDQPAIGEASPSYLYSPLAPDQISRTVPEAQLIAILRQPIDRAYSQFVKHTDEGADALVDDFIRILDAEQRSVSSGRGGYLHHLREGFYHTQLERYYARFDADQLHVILYDDLCADPIRAVQSLFRALKIDPEVTPDVSGRINASGVPRSKALDRLLNGSARAKSVVKRLVPESVVHTLARCQNALKNRNLSRVSLPAATRRDLTHRYYRDDILKLQDLIQRDLSPWMQ